MEVFDANANSSLAEQSPSLVLYTPSNDRPPLRVGFSRFSPGPSGLSLKKFYCLQHPDLRVSDIRLMQNGRLIMDSDQVRDEAEVFVIAPRLEKKRAAAPPSASAHQKASRQREQTVPTPPVVEQNRNPPVVVPDPVVAPPPVPPANARPRMKLGLLIRLAALVLLLAQGGDSTRAALLCAGAFFLYAWSSLSARVFVAGQVAGVGKGILGELHDLFVPLLLSLSPTWRVDVFLGERPDVPPPMVEEDEDEENQ